MRNMVQYSFRRLLVPYQLICTRSYKRHVQGKRLKLQLLTVDEPSESRAKASRTEVGCATTSPRLAYPHLANLPLPANRRTNGHHHRHYHPCRKVDLRRSHSLDCLLIHQCAFLDCILRATCVQTVKTQAKRKKHTALTCYRRAIDL